MFEIIFLIVLAGIWITVAVVNDVKKTEVPDWLNFSLIIFALGFRFFYCLFWVGNFDFLNQGLIGLGVFVVLGNLLYYSRFFAGGDAKLMMALGAILPLSTSIYENINFFIQFLLFFLISGLIYSLLFSFIIAIKNFKKFKREFLGKLVAEKRLICLIVFSGIFFIFVCSIYSIYLSLFGFVFFYVIPLLYLFAYAVEESSMIKLLSYNKLTEGDWLYRDVRLGKKVIISKWDGLSRKEINLLRKHKKNVWIKKGIPFTPAFLIGFIFFVLNLWYSFWNFNIF